MINRPPWTPPGRGPAQDAAAAVPAPHPPRRDLCPPGHGLSSLETEVKQITHAIRMAACNARNPPGPGAWTARYAPRAGNVSLRPYPGSPHRPPATPPTLVTASCSSPASTRSPPHGAPRPSPPSATSSTKPQACYPGTPISSGQPYQGLTQTLALREIPLYVSQSWYADYHVSP